MPITPQDLSAARRASPFFSLPDATDRLPAPARQKLELLRADADDKRAAAHAVYASIRDVTHKIAAVRNHIDELRRRNVPDGDPSILVEQELIEQLQADLAKMKARQQALSATAESAATLVNNIEAFVERARRLALTAAVTAVRRKGATVLEALDEIRAKIADEKDRLRAARVAPLPSSEAKAKAVGEIEALAERGRPDVTPVVDTGREIGFPTRAGDHVSLSQRTAYASENDQIDAVALVAWAFKEQLIAAIEREIDDNCDDVSALSKEERDVAIASAVADQLRLEREEESLVIIAIDSGLQVQRRADADPRAVLGLTDESGAL